MSQKRSKRKRSSREEYQLRERLKIEEGVFDERMMLNLRKLFSHGFVYTLEFIIAKGKEADVYVAEGGERVDGAPVIVKIFRKENTNFENRMAYLIGDPRFEKVKMTVSALASEWCRKEYGNLKLANAIGVRCPKPYIFSGNVLCMELIGEDGKPSQRLKAARPENPAEMLGKILIEIKKLYSGNLVHADISEYNILVMGNNPYLIDFGQAVVLDHPNAESFLERDVHNILAYFAKKYGIEKDESSVLEEIRAGKGSSK